MLSFGDTFINTQKYEVLEHGTAEFPIACYFDNLNQKFNPWHWHEEFEVGIVRENPVMISTPDSQRRLEKGDCFFINSGFCTQSKISARKTVWLILLFSTEGCLAGIWTALFGQNISFLFS